MQNKDRSFGVKDSWISAHESTHIAEDKREICSEVQRGAGYVLVNVG